MSLPEHSVIAIYRAAMSVEEFDAFARDWSGDIDEWLGGDTSPEAVEQHFETALVLLDRLLATANYVESPEEYVSALPQAAAILSRNGRVLAQNAAFSGAFGRISTIGDIAESDSDARDIRGAILSLNELAEQKSELVAFRDRDSRLQVMSIRPLPLNLQGGDRACVAVLASDSWTPALESFFETRFALTAAECRLLEQIVRGGSFRDIADTLGKSEETLKSQSKSIYRKLGVANREACLRLMMQIEGIIGGTKILARPKPSNPREGVLQLADGRRIGWTLRGAKDGRRVLFLHGMILGHAMSEAFERGLVELGLTAVCIDRPGYGRSDPPRDWRAPVDEWIDIFPELASRLQFAGQPILCSTTGVVYALAAAGAHPDMVTGVFALGAGVPITDPAMFASYPLYVRLAARTSRVSASAVRFFIMAAASNFRYPQRRDRLIDRNHGVVEVDAHALRDPATRAAVSEGYDLVADGGFDGYVGDCMLVFQDWSHLSQPVTCPVHYVNGSEDTVCPVEWARAYAQKWTHMTVESIEGGGQLISYTHPEACLSELRDFLTRVEH